MKYLSNKIIKRVFNPEIFLIISTIYYWTQSIEILNPFAISILLAFILLLKYKNNYLGIILSLALTCFSVYMLTALIMELREFTAMNRNFIRLITTGPLYILSNTIVSLWMLIKYTNIAMVKQEHLVQNIK